MPRVTLLTTGLALGGAEAQVALLASGLHRRGWDVEVVSMLPPEAHQDRLASDGIAVIDLKMRRGVPDPRSLLRLTRELRRFRPHVLHCHMVHANILGRLARMFHRRVTVISTAHSVWEGGSWRDFAYRATDFLCDLTTNVSQAGLQRYARLGLSSSWKTIWVPNGVDTSAYRSDPGRRQTVRDRQGWEEKFVWLAVGNLRAPKDYPNLLDAIARLDVQAGTALFAIAGTGELDAELRAMATRLGISDRVSFLGRRTDIPDLLAAADGYVMSSCLEGTPMALLEAAAAALPIVATRVGGNSDVIDSGRNGILIEPGDPDALAGAVRRIMGLPSTERQQLGEAARKKVDRMFSVEPVLIRWENIYRQLIDSRSTSRWRPF